MHVDTHVDRLQTARECNLGKSDTRVQIPRKTAAWLEMGTMGRVSWRCSKVKIKIESSGVGPCPIALEKKMEAWI
jgi:hypothetical protein